MRMVRGSVRPWLIAVLGAAVAAVLVTSLVVVLRPPIEARPLKTQPLAPSDYHPVDQAAIDYLADYGTEVALIPTDQSPQKAVEVAMRSFGQTAVKEPQQVSLATATVAHYGIGTDNAHGTKGLKLTIQDRRVWVVIFDGFKNFAFGPAPSKLGKGSPASYDITRLVVSVDEATNEFLLSETSISLSRKLLLTLT